MNLSSDQDQDTPDHGKQGRMKVSVRNNLISEGRSEVLESIVGGPRELRPREVPKAWLAGLKAFGMSAKLASVRRDGQWRTMPLVVEFPCPFDHLDSTGDDWAKVRLRIDPDTGWVSLREGDGCCERCNSEIIEGWLVTCPQCLDLEPGHPEHPPFWIDWDHFPEDMADEEIRKILGVGADWDGGPDGSPLATVIATMDEMVRRPATATPTSGALPAREWTPEAARDWLGSLVKEDGSLVVPVEATYREMWATVSEMSEHPPKKAAEDGHRLRKNAVSS